MVPSFHAALHCALKEGNLRSRQTDRQAHRKRLHQVTTGSTIAPALRYTDARQMRSNGVLCPAGLPLTASLRMVAPLAASRVGKSPNRASPGLKGFRSCFVAGPALPSPSTDTAKLQPGSTRDSIARSLATCRRGEGEWKDGRNWEGNE